MLRQRTCRLLSKIIEQETLIFPRTVETVTKLPDSKVETDKVTDAPVSKEPEVDDWESIGVTWRSSNKMAAETGFTYKGNEPTMFGDWQHKGRATDF